MKLSSPYIPIILLFISIQFISFSSSPPEGNTDAPGEGRCLGCHNTPPINHPNPVGSGGIEFVGITDGMTIEPNTAYPLQIKLRNFSPNGTRAGFELVILDGNESNSASIGSFENLGARVETANFGGGPRTYLRHSSEFSFSSNEITYSADWVSPAEITGAIYFYVTGIVANGSGADGDFYAATSVSTAVPLSVELGHFHLEQLRKESVRINWETLSENNSDYFEVLRSSNGIDFKTLGKIPAAGISIEALSYIFIDKEPILNQMSFYRLKQVDLTGDFTYTPTKSIEVLDFQENKMTFLPNPVHQGGCIFVDFLATQDYPNATLQVFDTAGRELADLKTILPNGLIEGFNKIIVDTTNLPEGIYFLNVHDGREVLANQTVVVSQ